MMNTGGLLGKVQRREGIARFARELERRFGRIEDLAESKSVGVITEKTLQRESLEKLFSHSACAIHVPGFYPASSSATKAKKLLELKDAIQNWKVTSEKGLESSDVLSVGKPYNMAAAEGREAVRAYFDGAVKNIRRFREDVPPGQPLMLGPLDKLRLELDEIWPTGAMIRKNKAGNPFLAGVARIMHGPTRYIDGFMHVDELAPMVPHRGVFSANVYLSVPPTGGELAVWPVAFRSRWDFYRHAETLSQLTAQGEEGQSLLRERLPSPINISVGAGDLVLLCVQRPHAAQGFPMGTRVSMQSFITFERHAALMLDN